MRPTVLLLAAVLCLSCGDSPTGPGEELVGTWVGVSTTDDPEDLFAGLSITLRADGTTALSLVVEGITISFEGTWEIVGGKLLLVVTIGGESTQSTYEFTIRGDRLTLVDEQDGVVEIYERQS